MYPSSSDIAFSDVRGTLDTRELMETVKFGFQNVRAITFGFPKDTIHRTELSSSEFSRVEFSGSPKYMYNQTTNQMKTTYAKLYFIVLCPDDVNVQIFYHSFYHRRVANL